MRIVDAQIHLRGSGWPSNMARRQVTSAHHRPPGPGFRGALIAYLPGDLVIYQSRPTQGRPVIRSPYGSFRAGIQMLPVKIGDLSTGRFQTIIEAVDPRHAMAFGEAR